MCTCEIFLLMKRVVYRGGKGGWLVWGILRILAQTSCTRSLEWKCSRIVFWWLLFHNLRILTHKTTWKRKSSIDSFLRYGNPESQISGTLKNKIQIWNKKVKSLEHNTRTFSLQASCAQFTSGISARYSLRFSRPCWLFDYYHILWVLAHTLVNMAKNFIKAPNHSKEHVASSHFLWPFCGFTNTLTTLRQVSLPSIPNVLYGSTVILLKCALSIFKFEFYWNSFIPWHCC